MIIGNFTYDPDQGTYSGAIKTLTFQREAVLIRPVQKIGEREPDYRVVHGDNGGQVEFGAAWKRTSERGRDFLSIVLDDPALPASLNAALFPDNNENTATLVWTRSTRKEPSANAKPATAPTKKSAKPRPPSP
jgi:uncharacterized protein (DUF736 family)